MGTVADNLSAVQERIAKAATRVGRDPAGVTLVAVTKTMSVERIREAIELASGCSARIACKKPRPRSKPWGVRSSGI